MSISIPTIFTKSRNVAGAIVVRGLGVILQCLLQIVVARLAGPAGVSVLQIFQSWTCLSGEAAAMGLPLQLMKQAAVLGDSATTRQLLILSIHTIVRIWLILFVIAVVLRLINVNWFQTDWPIVLVASAATLCFALQRVLADLLKALNQVSFSIFAETSVVPVGVIILCLIAAAQNSSSPLVIINLVYFAAAWLALATALCLAKSLSLLTIRRSTETSTAAKQQLFQRETAYFWVTSMLAIAFLNLPFFIMPQFGGIEELGRFTIAFKLINPITTILIMLSAFFAPSFSRASAAQDQQALRKQLVRSQYVSLALYIPILIPVLVFKQHILLVFGQNFAGAEFYIVVLALCQLTNAATGLAGTLLNMVGKGKYELYITICLFSATAIGSLLIGPKYGTQGIAVVYASGFAIKNICSYLCAWQYTKTYNQQQSLEGASL